MQRQRLFVVGKRGAVLLAAAGLLTGCAPAAIGALAGALATPVPQGATVTITETVHATSPADLTRPAEPVPTGTSPADLTRPWPAPTETGDVDWSRCPIIVDGVCVTDNYASLDPGSMFPTHVPLGPIVAVLHDLGLHDGQVEVAVPEDGVPVIRVKALDGREIYFRNNSAEFVWETDGETGSESPAGTPGPADLVQIFDGQVYVPIWFLHTFGASAAYFEGGHVFIYTSPTDMH